MSFCPVLTHRFADFLCREGNHAPKQIKPLGLQSNIATQMPPVPVIAAFTAGWRDPIDREMVRSINEIGHLTGKQTIAEFAENAEII